MTQIPIYCIKLKNEFYFFKNKNSIYLYLSKMINVPFRLISVLLTDYISQTSYRKEIKVNLRITAII